MDSDTVAAVVASVSAAALFGWVDWQIGRFYADAFNGWSEPDDGWAPRCLADELDALRDVKPDNDNAEETKPGARRRRGKDAA